MMYWGGGVKIKSPWGRRGSYSSSGIGGGGGQSDVFHWFLLSLKVKASWGEGGGKPPRPPISQMILPTISNIQTNKKVAQ